MSRVLLSLLCVSAVALALGACDQQESLSASDFGPTPGGGSCGGNLTCGSCTPVQGCGWCFTLTQGYCTTDPDSCPIQGEFTWTWDPPGCPGAVDAGVVPLGDAGSVTVDATSAREASDDGGVESSTEAGADAPPEGSPPEASGG